jgi:CRISPR type III-B/RAMP module-associated protein Cmr3
MNTLLLQPADVLFFRDGRPMSESLSGHGAAWPLPTVISAALHAALWRSEIPSHAHRRGRSGKWNDDQRDRKFGSLFSAGPFPESAGTWYFPRPADAMQKGSTQVTIKPILAPSASSLPKPLTHALASTAPPTKDKPEGWFSRDAWQHYLKGEAPEALAARHFTSDSDFCDQEHTIGIGIDPETGTQNEDQFYSANYLRLKPQWRMACLAEAKDKEHQGADIIPRLFTDHPGIVVGGQQRVCSAMLQQNQSLPLPVAPAISGNRVKWILLTPAIFPTIGSHPGGSLPSWVNHQSGEVELLDGPGKNAAQRRGVPIGQPIKAKLVAALVGKSIPITGYALPHETTLSEGGAKPTHLAVPAGSVYYFECDDEASAQKLAAALNWHGSHSQPSTVTNRRSTLMGEKGLGLGVCTSWSPLSNP